MCCRRIRCATTSKESTLSCEVVFYSQTFLQVIRDPSPSLLGISLLSHVFMPSTASHRFLLLLHLLPRALPLLEARGRPSHVVGGALAWLMSLVRVVSWIHPSNKCRLFLPPLSWKDSNKWGGIQNASPRPLPSSSFRFLGRRELLSLSKGTDRKGRFSRSKTLLDTSFWNSRDERVSGGGRRASSHTTRIVTKQPAPRELRRTIRCGRGGCCRVSSSTPKKEEKRRRTAPPWPPKSPRKTAFESRCA